MTWVSLLLNVVLRLLGVQVGMGLPAIMDRPVVKGPLAVTLRFIRLVLVLALRQVLIDLLVSITGLQLAIRLDPGLDRLPGH
jgi:hypothetical protein